MNRFQERQKKFRPFRLPKRDIIMVAHGHRNHTLKESKDCAICQQIFNSWKKDQQNGLTIH
jgi:hypothetical protein